MELFTMKKMPTASYGVVVGKNIGVLSALKCGMKKRIDLLNLD
jgi:hypothetical protein